MIARKLLWGGVTLLLSMSVFATSEHNDIQVVNTPFDHYDGSDRFRKSRELVRHAVNQAQLASQGFVATAAVSIDVGDVAVIVDNGSILIPPKPASPFDLTVPSGLKFAAGSDFTVSATSTTLDGTFGGDLMLTDDDASEVEVVDSGTFNSGAGFPYLGTSYTTDLIFVGSDGHITFGVPEASSTPRDPGRHVGGPPRISAFFTDLDPTCAGAVHADVRTDRIVVTWSGVPPFLNTGCDSSLANTFQAVLHSSGDIDLVFDDIKLSFAIVGIAEGSDIGPITVVDYTADLPLVDEPAGAIFEEFFPAITIQQMDVIALAEEFYNTHDDVYDFLVMFAEDVVDIGGGFAFHAGFHSDTEGLGFFRRGGTLSSVFDDCDAVGLLAGCEMESILNMNRIGLYWPDANKQVDPPIRKFRFFCFSPGGTVVPCAAGAGFPSFPAPPGGDQKSIRARWMGTFNGDFGLFRSYTLGLNSAMSVMGQEAGHRWLAFPAVIEPDFSLTNVLLGRSNAHWSFFHDVTVPSVQFADLDGDPRASSAEGNSIADLGTNAACQGLGLGSKLFQTQPNELVDGFTELDQYFIGVRTPPEVSDFFYIDNPTVVFGGSPNAASSPRDDVLICGERVDRTLSDITDIGDIFLPFIPSNGTRDPLIGDEQDTGPGIGAADVAKCTNDRECVDVKTMAFILLVANAPNKNNAAVKQVDTFRQTWEEYGNGAALGGRGARGIEGDSDFIPKFDTSLDPDIH